MENHSQIESLSLPELKSEEAKNIISNVEILLKKVSTFIREKSNQL